MKILILLPNDSLGGAEQYLKMVADYFTKASVHIYFLQASEQASWSGSGPHIQLHYPKSRGKWLSILGFAFDPAHRDHGKYDLIFTSHVYTTGLIGILLRLGLLRTTHFIARESTSIFLRFKGIKLLSYKLFYRLGYKKVDLLICQTEVMKQQLLTGAPFLQKITEIQVIPNPINYALIKDQEREVLIEELPGNYLVSAGRLIHEKGYDILINAFAQLKPTYPDLKLIILGEGKLRGTLTEQIARLNLENDVVLRGFVKNVYPYFKRAKACVVSSRVEGFPNVLLQMMSQNPKVVSTECAGGIKEIPGIYLSLPDNVESLRSALYAALGSEMDNRKIFDDYLKSRDISSFIVGINNYLKYE